MSRETFRESTNATQFNKRQRLPTDFATILKEYSREVLREQPDDILTWSAQYFKRLAMESDPMLATGPPDGHYAPEVADPEQEVAVMRITKALAALDKDNSGHLHVLLVKRVLTEALGLSRAQALYILSRDYAAVSDDALIEYRALARDCAPAVMYFTSDSAGEFPEVQHADDEPTVHGRIRDDIEGTLMRAAADADADGLGRIPFALYKRVLETVSIDLTRSDMGVLLAEAEVTRDGTVDIRAEVGRAFDLLLLSATFSAFDEQGEQ